MEIYGLFCHYRGSQRETVMPEHRQDNPPPFTRIATLATRYFAIVFVAGMVLGFVRVLLIAPATGSLAAVALELPVMLGIAWWAAGRVLGEKAVFRQDGAALIAIGAIAFLLLMIAEAGLAILGFGQSVSTYLAAFATAPGVLGLVGQIAFAAIPRLRRRA